jgi:hypothetical protein
MQNEFTPDLALWWSNFWPVLVTFFVFLIPDLRFKADSRKSQPSLYRFVLGLFWQLVVIALVFASEPVCCTYGIELGHKLALAASIIVYKVLKRFFYESAGS